MTIISYVWVVSMYLSSIYLSLPDEPCWKPQLQQRRRTAEAESGLQNPQILWDQFTSPTIMREDFLEPAPKASNAFAAGMVHKHSARKLRQVKCANIK